MAHLLIFGFGYSALRIRDAAQARGFTVSGTGSAGALEFADRGAVEAALAGATHALSSVPPERATSTDPVLEAYGAALARFADGGGWLGYLSSTGVYGDAGGAWVDEQSPVGGGRRIARAACDLAWLERRARVFRLPGIYGPDRNVFNRLAEGGARRIDLPEQIFSRVHVDDIATGAVAGFDAPAGAYNLADDLPASQNAVIEEACRLRGYTPPPLVSLAEADLSPAALGFYSENRRVANEKAKRVLGWRPRYPTYREGLAAISRSVRPASGP